MSSDPVTVNKTATTINTGIKIAGSTAVNLVQALVTADFPFLGLPVIKQIFSVLLNCLSTYIIQALETGATFAVIDLQVGHEVSQMSKAVKAVVEAEKKGNADEIKKAIEAYAEAHSALVHSDGSASAQ